VTVALAGRVPTVSTRTLGLVVVATFATYTADVGAQSPVSDSLAASRKAASIESGTSDKRFAQQGIEAAQIAARLAARRVSTSGWLTSGVALGIPIGFGGWFIMDGQSGDFPARLVRPAAVGFNIVVVVAASREPTPPTEREAWSAVGGAPLLQFDRTYAQHIQRRRMKATLIGGATGVALGYLAWAAFLHAFYPDT